MSPATEIHAQRFADITLFSLVNDLCHIQRRDGSHAQEHPFRRFWCSWDGRGSQLRDAVEEAEDLRRIAYVSVAAPSQSNQQF